jgi:hypothetical protein
MKETPGASHWGFLCVRLELVLVIRRARWKVTHGVAVAWSKVSSMLVGAGLVMDIYSR